MRELRLKPRVQIWVCVNERSAQELPSCRRSRGEDLVAAMIKAIARLVPDPVKGDVWINRSLCQGSCTAHGVSIVLECSGTGGQAVGRRFAAATPEDAESVIAAALDALGAVRSAIS